MRKGLAGILAIAFIATSAPAAAGWRSWFSLGLKRSARAELEAVGVNK